MSQSYGPAGKIAKYFINSKLTPLIIVASVLLGLAAVVALPREEEPQIIVPMIDIFVQMPGSDAAEAEDEDGFFFVVIFLDIVHEAVEEGRWRKLFLVPYHDNLACAGNDTQRIFGFDLRGFIDHQNVELCATWRQELGH